MIKKDGRNNISSTNLDLKTVKHFGQEWKYYSQKQLLLKDKINILDDYFHIFDWKLLSKNSICLDVGSGSGRWAEILAKKVKSLILIDASIEALEVSKSNLIKQNNVMFINGSIGSLPIRNNSIDFVYSLGVLHHVPNTQQAIIEIGEKLKKNKPVLLYLYYDFENKHFIYKIIWKISDILRKFISKLPNFFKINICKFIAIFIYFPIAKITNVLEYLKIPTNSWPLSYYKDKPFYVMTTDALDRFGTPLEKRFSKAKITQMLIRGGFKNIKFSEKTPYWCVFALKG